MLGPRGLMPSERRGTVLEDFAGYFRRLRGTAEWRGDKSGTIRTPIAKVGYSGIPWAPFNSLIFPKDAFPGGRCYEECAVFFECG